MIDETLAKINAMPDLSLKASHQFWRDYQDPMIYRVIAFMESVETWTRDGDARLEAAMKKLGDALEKLKKYELGKEAEFINLGCHIKTSRILRYLQAIDSIEPGSASRTLMYAEEHSAKQEAASTLFLQRNIVFERLRLLARVFSKERITLLTKALEGNASE